MKSTVRATYIRAYTTPGYIVVIPSDTAVWGKQLVARDATYQTLVANDQVLLADEGLRSPSWVAIVKYPPIATA